MKQLLLFFLLSITMLGRAQTISPDLSASFQQYGNAIKSGQYTQATSYMPLELFEYFSKEQLVKEMKQTFESEGTEVAIKSVEIISLDGSQKVVDGKQYQKFTFKQKFNIKYINLFDATDDEQSRSSTTRFIVDMLNESLPESTVDFDKSKEVFLIENMKKAVAIKGQDATTWKFIVLEPSLKELTGFLIPMEVLKK